MPKVTKEHNFQKLFPKLAKQWHPQKNGDLRPKDVAPYTQKKVWWVCDVGHEYQTAVHHRSQGSGCPFCSGRKRASNISEWESKKQKLGLVMGFRMVGRKTSGKVLVEMPQEAWENLALLTLPMKDLGTAVVDYRKTHGLSQEEFGKKIGCSRNFIVSLENGKDIVSSARILRRIILALTE